MTTDLVTALRRATAAARRRDLHATLGILRDALRGREPEAKPAAPRGSLREVVEELRARPTIPPETEAPPAGPVGVPGDMIARTFACDAGARDYQLFVPAGPPRGLLLMLHGCGQTPEDFATGTRMNALAARHDLLVAWPEQGEAHNPRGCWNWFEPAHQQRGAGEPAILSGLVEALAKEFAQPPGRAFVAGLSAGGSMAAILGETYPELFEAVGVHSGLACGTAQDVRSALAAMRGAPAAARPLAVTEAAPRVIVVQGTADQVVHPMNADRIMARACALAGVRPSPREAHAVVGGREVSRTVARAADGIPAAELWMVEGGGHAWSGGDGRGSFSDPAGPDASAEMLRFFLSALPKDQKSESALKSMASR